MIRKTYLRFFPVVSVLVQHFEGRLSGFRKQLPVKDMESRTGIFELWNLLNF